MNYRINYYPKYLLHKAFLSVPAEAGRRVPGRHCVLPNTSLQIFNMFTIPHQELEYLDILLEQNFLICERYFYCIWKLHISKISQPICDDLPRIFYAKNWSNFFQHTKKWWKYSKEWNSFENTYFWSIIFKLSQTWSSPRNVLLNILY